MLPTQAKWKNSRYLDHHFKSKLKFYYTVCSSEIVAPYVLKTLLWERQFRSNALYLPQLCIKHSRNLTKNRRAITQQRSGFAARDLSCEFNFSLLNLNWDFSKWVNFEYLSDISGARVTRAEDSLSRGVFVNHSVITIGIPTMVDSSLRLW